MKFSQFHRRIFPSILFLSFPSSTLSRPSIASGVQYQQGTEKLITSNLENKLKSLEPILLKKFQEISDFPINYVRPISYSYLTNDKGTRLFVKYQVDTHKYYHVKIIPPTTTSPLFIIAGISFPKSNYDKLSIF